MNTPLSRRATLKMLVAAPLLGSALAACSKDEALSCTDVSGLTEPEKTTRNALQYVDKSPYPERVCTSCTLYVPGPDPKACGTCQVIKGPIHPDGYCASYAQKS